MTVCNKPFQGLQQQEDFQLLKTKAQHLQQPWEKNKDVSWFSCREKKKKTKNHLLKFEEEWVSNHSSLGSVNEQDSDVE